MARGTNRSPRRKGLSYTKYGYIFIAPFVIVYCLFSLYPLLTTFWYSTANMKTTTADFWGFDDKEVYYDRYLDLTKYLGDDPRIDSSFDNNVGMKLREYNVIRNFFLVQDTADQYAPLDSGVKNIINFGTNDFVSQSTLDMLQQCYDNDSMEYMTADGYSELNAWYKNYSTVNAEATNMQSSMSKIFTTLDAIANPVSASEEEEEAIEITPETIITSEEYQEFLDKLADTSNFDENQTLWMDYLASEYADEVSLWTYFNKALDDQALISDPTFYFICEHLQNPSAYVAEEGEDGETSYASVGSVSVDFMSDLTAYLTGNDWIDVVNNLDSFESLEAYGAGEEEVPSGTDTTLYEDIQSLQNAGIINVVSYVYDGTTFAPATDGENANLLYSLENYNPREISDEERLVALQISDIKAYWEAQGRADIASFATYADSADAVNVDKYITFNGEFSIKKYNQFKEDVMPMGWTETLADKFTLDFYDDMNDVYMDNVRLVNQYKLDNEITPAEETEAAYEAAKQMDIDDHELLQYYNAWQESIIYTRMAEEKIDNPPTLYSKVDASKKYLCVGFDNFKEIFTSTSRRNTVFGAFVTTAEMWVVGFVPQILLALLLSAWFTDTKLHLKGLGLMKALMYLPNVITAVTVAIFFRRLFSYSTNPDALPPVQYILRNVFNDPDGYNFFQKAWPTRLIVCFINFWMWYGNTMIVLIAGITSINESLYESAQIDGANSFQTYTKITMPLLRPILLYTMVTSMIGGLQMYDIPQNLNMNPALINFNGTYIRSTQTVLMYVNNMAFGKAAVKQVGIASATSVLLFIVTTVLSLIIFYIMRDKDAAKAAKAKKLARKAGAAK